MWWAGAFLLTEGGGFLLSDGLMQGSNSQREAPSGQFVQMGVRQLLWTAYTVYPRRRRRPAIVSYTTLPPSRNALSRPSRYHDRYPVSSTANSS